MPEGVGDRPVADVRIAIVRIDDRHEDPPFDRLAQRVADLARRPLHDLGEELVVDAAAGRRGGPEDLARRGRQPRDADQQDVPQARRQVEGRGVVGLRWAGLVAAGRSRLAAGVEELLNEEGVAVGPVEQGVDEFVVGIAAEGHGHEGADLAPPERAELDPLDVVLPLQLGDLHEQRLAVADLVAPHRGHDEDGTGAEHAREVRQEIERGPVRPLEVLDDEHERSLPGDPLEDVEDGLEELGSRPSPGLESVGIAGARSLELGDQAAKPPSAGPEQGRQVPGRDAPDELAQGRDERGEREATVADPQALAGEDAGPAGPRPSGELLDEPGLADPGLAADEHDAGACRRTPGRSSPRGVRAPRPDRRTWMPQQHRPRSDHTRRVGALGSTEEASIQAGGDDVRAPSPARAQATSARVSDPRSRERARHRRVRVAA